MKIQDKAQNEIKNLINSKLLPAIAPQVKARDQIKTQRTEVEASRQTFLKKIDGNSLAISELEKALDEKIVAGKSADDILQRIITRKAEINAFERHIQRLSDQDIELAIAEQNANIELSEAIGHALEDLRPDVESLIKDKLEECLSTLIFFQHESEKLADGHGVSIVKHVESRCFRFLKLDDVQSGLKAYLGSIGEDMSIVMRREVSKRFFAELAERQEKAKAQAA